MSPYKVMNDPGSIVTIEGLEVQIIELFTLNLLKSAQKCPKCLFLGDFSIYECPLINKDMNGPANSQLGYSHSRMSRNRIADLS